MTHREPGLAGAILASEEVAAELICDGHHVHQAFVRMTLARQGPPRVMAITDGTAGSGLPAGARATLGGRPITVREVARLDDGTLAGSVATMDQVFAWLVARAAWICAKPRSICATTPAREIGLVGFGVIAPGGAADLDRARRATTRLSRPGLEGSRPGPEHRRPRTVFLGVTLPPSCCASLTAVALGAPACVVNVDHEGTIERVEKRFAVDKIARPAPLHLRWRIEVRSWDRPEVLVQIEKRGQDKDAVAKIEILSEQKDNRISGRSPAHRPHRLCRLRRVPFAERAADRERAHGTRTWSVRTGDGNVMVERVNGRTRDPTERRRDPGDGDLGRIARGNRPTAAFRSRT